MIEPSGHVISFLFLAIPLNLRLSLCNSVRGLSNGARELSNEIAKNIRHKQQVCLLELAFFRWANSFDASEWKDPQREVKESSGDAVEHDALMRSQNVPLNQQEIPWFLNF